MVEFDVESDDSFLRTLDEVGATIAEFVLTDLFTVAAQLSWDEFSTAYNWRPHDRLPVETYPGAIEYFRFTVKLPSGMRPGLDAVEIFAKESPGTLVLCAVAQ